jgi:hypothetical protein
VALPAQAGLIGAIVLVRVVMSLSLSMLDVRPG